MTALHICVLLVNDYPRVILSLPAMSMVTIKKVVIAPKKLLNAMVQYIIYNVQMIVAELACFRRPASLAGGFFP